MHVTPACCQAAGRGWLLCSDHARPAIMPLADPDPGVLERIFALSLAMDHHQAVTCTPYAYACGIRSPTAIPAAGAAGGADAKWEEDAVSTEPICKQKQHVKVRLCSLEGRFCNNTVVTTVSCA